MLRIKDIRSRYAIVRERDWRAMRNKGYVFVEPQCTTNDFNEAIMIQSDCYRDDYERYLIIDTRSMMAIG